MEQIAFKRMLDAGQAAGYRRRLDPIWPEWVTLLRDAGISDDSIFLDDDSHLLFAVLRRKPDHRMDALPGTELMQLWWRQMADIMQTEPDASPRQRPLQAMFPMD